MSERHPVHPVKDVADETDVEEVEEDLPMMRYREMTKAIEQQRLALLSSQGESLEYHRVTVEHQSDAGNEEKKQVCCMLYDALKLRDKYVPPQPDPVIENTPQFELNKKKAVPFRPFNPFHGALPAASSEVFRFVNGVMEVYADEASTANLHPVLSAKDFFIDMNLVLKLMSFGPAKSVCHRRLLFLESKFNMHLLLNDWKELEAQKNAPHRDFYNTRKVDGHVHHSSCMNQKHLLRFIKHKLKTEKNVEVINRHGKVLTLHEVFKSLNLTAYDLSVDMLDMRADKTTFHRFDRFNLKYNPIGSARLREIFIKTDNYIKGRYLAELTREVFADLEQSKYQMAEYRVSVYGRAPNEWVKLAAWVCNNELYSDNVRWLIQVPRLYQIYHEQGLVTNFQDMLNNIFEPLFAATRDPGAFPNIHRFLQQVVGLDCVDDESKPERRVHNKYPPPSEWTMRYNPPYSYYMYYLYANLTALNAYRKARGFNVIAFRPHCGEAGDVDHLAATYLVADSINHGINLKKSPVLQYLFYLKQIGLAMSPLSNNSLFISYHKNPLPTFFNRGLNVALSTDDPLQVHFTKEPLVEEYSVAAQVWKLSSADLCEMARNSVLQSGFEPVIKAHWLGRNYFKPGPEGNDIHKSNVPSIRLQFRYETLQSELQYVIETGGLKGSSSSDAAASSASGESGTPKRTLTVPKLSALESLPSPMAAGPKKSAATVPAMPDSKRPRRE